MSAPLTVVVPNYNHARFLPNALDALLSQSRQPCEIVVVDDASTDESRKIIAAYAARHALIRPVYRHRNSGVIAVMNEALHTARSPYIYFAAADDLVMPGFFSESFKLLEHYPQAAYCSALSHIIDSEGNDCGIFPTPIPISKPGMITPREAERHLMREGAWTMGNTVIYRRDALLAEGGFRPELQGFCDGFAHLALALAHGACFIPRPLACWRRLRGSVSDQTTSNIATTIAVIEIATQVMSTDPSNRFRPSLIRRIRDRWLFGSARVLLSRDTFPVSDMLALFPTGHAFDHVLLRAFISAGVPQLATGYLFLRQRPYDLLPLIRRRLGYVLRGNRGLSRPSEADAPTEHNGLGCETALGDR